MNIFTHLTTALLGACLLISCHTDSQILTKPQPQEPSFYTGADVSWMTEMMQQGHRFHTVEGQELPLLSLLRNYGLQAVRLRVWVDPTAHGNWCNAQDLLTKAQLADEQGMSIMVNFHYSDWWADPGKQNIPASWKGHTYEQMKTEVANHTREVLQLLKNHHITPRWIQVGNETSNGFLWPIGQADLHPEQYAGLFKSGYDVCKEVFPKSAVLVHLDNGPDLSLYEWNLGLLKKYGAQWDMIGMSVYPYWSMKSGNFQSADQVIEQSVANIRSLHHQFGCDVMVVETGMECADEQGQLASPEVLIESKRQLAKLLKLCRDSTEGHCSGVFYWEPECKPHTYRLGAFTEEGRPTPIMDAFRE